MAFQKSNLPKNGEVLFVREKGFPNFRPWKEMIVTGSGRDSFLAVVVKSAVLELHIKPSTHEWVSEKPEEK